MNNTLAQMKRQDKGPTTESEIDYLVTLKSKFGELFKLGYNLTSASVNMMIYVVMCTNHN